MSATETASRSDQTFGTISNTLVATILAATTPAVTIAATSASIPDAPRTISMKEVHRHRWASDCWVVCNGKVYDITAFVPNHPGGSRMWTFCGDDITVLFHAMHPPRVSVQSHLAKYYIGEVEDHDSSNAAISDLPGLRVSDQYLALRAFVWDSLSKDFGGVEKFSKIFQSPITWMLWYPVFTIIYFAGLLGLLYLPRESISDSGRAGITLVTGVMAAHTSFVIHEATHNRMRYGGLFWSILLGDFSGFWTHAFVHEHFAHHQTVGDSKCEVPDIFDNMPFLRHRELEQHRPWHKYQHLYFPVGWSIFLLKSVVVDLFRLISGWSLYNSKRDVVMLSFSKLVMIALVACSIIIGPFQGQEAWKLVLLLCFLFAIAGCIIGLTVGVVHVGAFSVSHKTFVSDGSSPGEAKPTYVACDGPGANSGDFMEAVIHQTISAVPRWKVLNFFTLGLAYHVEHHLFPSVPWWLLPRVNELVTQYCKENGIKCNNNLSYSQGYACYIDAIRQLGRPVALPNVAPSPKPIGASLPESHKSDTFAAIEV